MSRFYGSLYIMAKRLDASRCHLVWRYPQPRGLCVRWGPSLPPQKGGRAPSPQISAHVYCGQTTGWIKMALGMEVGLSPGDFIVLDGDPDPLPKKGAEPPPKFSDHFYCRQTAGCIKMPLGMEVGLSRGDFVFDGDPAPPQKEGGAPNFRPMSIAAKRLHGPRCHLVRR